MNNHNSKLSNLLEVGLHLSMIRSMDLAPTAIQLWNATIYYGLWVVQLPVTTIAARMLIR